MYDTGGTILGTGTRQIPPGGRFADLIPQLVGNLPPLTSGFFDMTSTAPVVSFALFGTNAGDVLSAIPPRTFGVCPASGCPRLDNLTISPSKVVGGQNTTGSVRLSSPALAGNAVVSLTNNLPFSTIPPSVTVNAGERTATFPITTSTPPTILVLSIGASYGGHELTTSLTICPAGACESLESLTISPSKVNGGQSATGTVKLDRPAVGNVVVSLSSNDPNAIVPSSVTMSNEIFSGQGGAFFTITTKVPSGIVQPTITASYRGNQRTAKLTVCPAGGCESLESLTISPSLVNGGQIATGTVRLHGPAVENVVVSLSSNDPNATVPSSVTVNSGEIGQAFLITTSVPSGIVHSTITARSGGIERAAPLTICPASGCESLTLGQKYRFHSQAREGTFIRHSNSVAGIAVLSTSLDRKDATFWVREGLWDKNARSFESIKMPGYYLRHQNFSLFLHENDGSSLFAKDATFRVVPGFADVNMLSFESINFPGMFVHASPSSGLLTLDSSSGSRFIREATFRPVRVIDGVHSALDLVDNFQKLSAEFNGVGDGAQVLSGTTYPITWEARGSACHIQGVARIGDRWVFSHNRCDYLGFLMSGTNGNFDFSEIKYGRHPGGIQAAGNVVAVPIKTEGATVSTAKDIIALYQIDSQGRAREIDSLDQKSGWESAGLAFHPEEDVYYLTASPNATSHDLSNHPVWKSQKGKSLADNDSRELVGRMKVTGSQEAVQLIFDEKTMRMYLITLIHPNDVVSSRIDFEMALTPLDLAKVNRTETVEFKPTLYRDDFPTIVGSPTNVFFIPAFRFGASAYIDSEGRLRVIATERDLPPRFPGDPGPRSTAYFTFR